MAAELDRFNQGEVFAGRGRMFYKGQTPWHDDGVELPFEKRNDFEWVMTTFFDYPMEKRPYYSLRKKTPEGGEIYNLSETAFYVTRTDTNRILGDVGESYEIVPNRDCFEVLRPLLDGGVAEIDTGGVLRGGADAWLLVQWDISRFGPNVQEVFQDEVLPFSTIMANHSGRRGILMGQTAIRIACANTLGAAEAEANGRNANRWVSVNHRTGAKVRLVEEAEKLFGGIVERYELIAKQYRLLKDRRLADEDFSRMVLDVVAPLPETRADWNPEAKLAEAVRERVIRKRGRLRELWFSGKGHTGDRSAWEAYNAVAEALDHDREMWPTRAGCWRTASLLTGELGKMKEKALDLLVRDAREALSA